MERSGLLRWLLLGLAAFLLLTFWSDLFGGGNAELQPLQPESTRVPESRQPERLCDLWTDRFHAQLTTQGATLKHFRLLSAKYRRDGEPIDLVTTPKLDFYRQLRFDWRNEALAEVDSSNGKVVYGDDWQVDYDRVDWELEQSTAQECVFSYESDKVRLKKIVRVTGRPYELAVRGVVTNRADRPLRHALTVSTNAWRTSEEVEGKMFRVSPYITHVECVTEQGDATRLQPGDFEPGEFSDEPGFKPTQLHRGDWYQPPGDPDLAAVSNAYFTHAVVPQKATLPGGEGARPVCQLQIEQRWDWSKYNSRAADPNSGAIYRARLAYPPVKLQPEQSAEYELSSYVGPKERKALAEAGGGTHNLTELIDLGFFSMIAKVLVAFLLKVYSVIPNWGVAIIILTLTARILLFPLSIPSIKSMIKMRELKPELDALNEKYKDDPQAKGLAQMELWRKHKVNPLKGCLPQLASLPVWIALYTTLQTAVELYNIPFLWFPDLSEPDPYYILPFIIGATFFLQQTIMPMQGDPMQQKMMRYFMPGMFTVFMLFLPSGLGVYMFTNSLLGIVQQQVVEWRVRRESQSAGGSGAGTSDIQVKVKNEQGSQSAEKGKKKKKGNEGDEPVQLSKSRPLLGKGKA